MGTRAFAILMAILAAACGGTAAPAGTAAPVGEASSTAPATAAATTAGGAAPTLPASPTKLVVAYSEIYEGSLPMWYAADKGFFKKNGIDADLRFIASSTGVAALLANEVQVFQGGGSEVLSAAVGGADLVLIANLVPTYPYVFMAQKDIATVADLKGKKVGVSAAGSTSDIATRVGLAKEGLDPDKDISIVYVGSSQNRTAALLAGSIQGGLDQPPGSLILEKQGLRSLFDMATLKLPVVNNGITVQRSTIAKERGLIQRYIDALVQATAALKKDKAGGMELLKKYLKESDPEILSKTYDYASGLFPALPYAKPDALADSVRVLGAKNAAVRSFDLKKLLDESFVKSAADRGLDK